MSSEPLEPRSSTPEEVRDRVVVERRGLPFLLYRTGAGEQAVLELAEDRERLTIGRRPSCDVPLAWDVEVSRVHAELERMGNDWVLSDEGLSHNGTFVNGERVRGRRRLRGGDVISVGETLIAFCAPPSRSTVATTAARERSPKVSVTPAQRRLLAALCRPLQAGAGYAAPATNQQIADELVVSVETVKGTLTALFERFGLQELPQNQKRAALAARALELLAGD
jgi:pSer/pThr/pTyr-binding forkhead associated (FHA) protein